MRVRLYQGATSLDPANQPDDAHSARQAGDQSNWAQQQRHVADLNSGRAATMYSTPDQIVVITAAQAIAPAA